LQQNLDVVSETLKLRPTLAEIEAALRRRRQAQNNQAGHPKR